MTLRSLLFALAVLAISSAVSGSLWAASPSPVPTATAVPNPLAQINTALQQEQAQINAICPSLHAGSVVGIGRDPKYPLSYLVTRIDCSLASYKLTWKRMGLTKAQTPAPSST